MTVFALTLYLCSTLVAEDVTSKACAWQFQDYYQTAYDCITAVRQEKVARQDGLENAQCTVIMVL